MNSSDIYDRTLFKSRFKDIYNEHKYNFQINKNILSNIITKWKNNCNHFTKATVWDNTTEYQNMLLLREFRIIMEKKEEKKTSDI